ncbi:hypothetical protein [Aurantibacillus circumpalustris]|nr:hypothetical protein [Aurantibacillus circumpalustris]
MKTTNSDTVNFDLELKELSKSELLVIKTAIVLFGTVLNICCIQLFF